MNALASDCLLPVLLLALTAVTGFVDAASYLAPLAISGIASGLCALVSRVGAQI